MNGQLENILKEAQSIMDGDNLTGKQKDIIGAALELFAEKGYDGTTTQAIAQKAKVSEKTLFKNFGSKQELFRQTVYPAMLKALQPILMERTDNILNNGKDYHDIFYAIFKDRVQFSIENTDVVKLVLQELLLSTEFREVISKFVKQNVFPRISQLSEKIGDVSLPAPVFGRIVFSLLAGYVIMRTILAPEQEWDDEKEIQLTLDVLFHGLDHQAEQRRG
ncbi:TetR/AcrR family transcriptional regulator [Thermoactinomyces daqus]|uniref:TetR/AcrR family transcriptional regulator n=1 Tax=Thermoactinomyces daqus TaxID=1329516 RepID=A0A7W2AJU9_9BACL|nr:TetR/AcrR family transcriptional regulator [Thermoactinomyces daqus]MBA4544243.1 TetR/AcrR family transcriptional regulator [Thermoactinomyces daqus]